MQRTAVAAALGTLVLGLVIGAAVGWTVGAPAEDLGAAGVGPAGAEPTTRAAPSAVPSAPAAPAAPGEAPPQRRAAAERATPRAASSTGAGAADPAPDGDGAIRGTVVGPDGAPVEGVLVRATPEGADDDEDEDEDLEAASHGAPPPRRDVEREIRRFAEQLRREEAGVREATTDAAGNYEIRGLGEGLLGVRAWRAGWRVARSAGHEWEPVPPGARCDFVATPIVELRANVLMPDGTQPAAAHLAWTAEGDEERGGGRWTPSSPAVEIAPGTYTVVATAGVPGTESEDPAEATYAAMGHGGDTEPAFRSEPQTVVVTAGGAPETTFRLAGRPGVTVRVHLPPGEPPTALRLAALRLESGSPDPARLVADASVRARWLGHGTTAGTITGLDPGRYLVGATLRGGRVLASTTVDVGAAPAACELRVEAPDLRDWVLVRVLAPDGSVVRDASIDCCCRSGDSSGSASVNVRPQADGSYRIPHYEQDAPSVGNSWSSSGDGLGPDRTYSVEVTSPRWGRVVRDYDPATDAEVVVQMTEPAILRVAVAGFSQNADRDRAVVAIQAAQGEERLDWGETALTLDAAGAGRSKPIPPGRYEVALLLAAGTSEHDPRNARWQGTELARVAVHATAGDNAVTLPFPRLCTVEVAFEGETPRLQRGGDGGDAEWVRVRTEPRDGRLSLALPVGRYRLTSDAGDQWFDVPAAGTVLFRPRPFDCLHLRVSGRGYLHELGLRTGDLVVAIDGAEVQGSEALSASIRLAKTRPKATYTVLRGTQRFDVVADPKRFEEDDGSWYQVWSR